MKKVDWHQLSIFAGIILLLFGFELRVVDAFVLTAPATATLARWTESPQVSPQGAMRQYVVEQTAYRHSLSPPKWLGWSFLCVGGMLTVHGLLQKLRK